MEATIKRTRQNKRIRAKSKNKSLNPAEPQQPSKVKAKNFKKSK